MPWERHQWSDTKKKAKAPLESTSKEIEPNLDEPHDDLIDLTALPSTEITL